MIKKNKKKEKHKILKINKLIYQALKPIKLKIFHNGINKLLLNLV